MKLNYSDALEALKDGERVARSGWNGKGMWVVLIPGTKDVSLRSGTPYHRALQRAYGLVTADEPQEILPHLDMWTVNGDGRRAWLVGWAASQSDQLANDFDRSFQDATNALVEISRLPGIQSSERQVHEEVLHTVVPRGES